MYYVTRKNNAMAAATMFDDEGEALVDPLGVRGQINPDDYPEYCNKDSPTGIYLTF